MIMRIPYLQLTPMVLASRQYSAKVEMNRQLAAQLYPGEVWTCVEQKLCSNCAQDFQVKSMCLQAMQSVLVGHIAKLKRFRCSFLKGFNEH